MNDTLNSIIEAIEALETSWTDIEDLSEVCLDDTVETIDTL